MLAIRLQRIGRSGHAQYRVVVQDSHFSPKSGRVTAFLGTYNPHSKAVKLDVERAQTYIDNGAQPSERVAGLLKQEGVKLPKWVKSSEPKQRTTRNPDKLRRNRPPEAEAPVKSEAAEEPPVEPAEAAAEPSGEEKAPETVEEAPEPPETEAEAPDAEQPPAEEAPAEESASEASS